MHLHRNSTFSPSSTAARRRILSLAGLAGAAMAVGLLGGQLQADTTATWTGANVSSNDYWLNSANWAGGVVPNNGSGIIYDVTIPSSASSPNSDLSGISPVIGQLTTQVGTTLYNSNGTGSGNETLTIDPSTMTVQAGSNIAGTVSDSSTALQTLDFGNGNASAVTSTISGVVSGNVALIVDQPTGSVVLSGANTYTGGTTINGGTLSISSDSNLGTGGITFGGGTLQTTAAISDSRSVTLNTSGGTIDTDGQSDTLSGNLTGAGGLTVESSLAGGVLILSGADTASGSILINSPATLEFSGDTTGFTGNITDNSALVFGQTAASSLSGIIAGSGTLTQNGTATLTLSGANNYSGTTTISSGTLEFAGSTAGLTGNVTDNSALSFNQTANSSLSGIISGTGTVTEAGSAGTILTLSGANTYSGGTNLNAGTVSVSAGSNLGTGTLTFNGGTLLTTAASIFSQGVIVNAGGAVVNTNGFTDTFNGFADGSGVLTVTGGGTAVVNNSFGFGLGYAIEGNSTINLSGFGPGRNNNSVTFSGNTTQGLLTYGLGGLEQQLQNVTISDTTATTTNIIDAGGGPLPIFGALSNSDPNATLVLRNGFFYFVGTNSGFTAGTVEITGGADLSVVSGTGALGTGAILALNSGTVIDNTTGLTFTNAVVVDAGGGTLDTNDKIWTISGGISGSGNLTVESSTAGGTLILSGADTASGSITINSGTTLEFSGDTAGFTGNIADNSALIFAQTAASSLSGLISGSGTLMQDGTAALTLSAANTYTGGTTINSGALIAANNAALGTGTVALAGGTLETPLAASAGASGANITLNTGTYTQSAGTTLGLALSGTPGSGNFDSLNVQGSASLNGALDALVQAGAKPAAGTKASYNIITTTGGVSGNFSSITLAAGSSTGFSYSGAISGNDYVLTLSSAFSFNTALSNYTPTQLSVANYLDTVGNSGTLPAGPLTFLQSLAGLTPGQLSVALTEIAPNAYTNIPNTLINASIFNSQALNGQIAGQFEGGGFNDSGLTLLKTTNTDPFSLALASALQSNSKVNAATTSAQYLDDVMQPAQGDVPLPSREAAHDSFGAFIAGEAILGSQPTSTSGQNYFTGGINSGVDYRFAKSLLVGISFNYSYTNAHVDGVGSVLTDNSYAPGLFAGYRKDNFYADVSADYTYTQFSIHRNLNIGGNVSTATGKPDTKQADLNTLIGYNFPVCSHFKAGPAIGLDYTHVNVSSYSETGSPGDLSVSRYSIDSLRSLLGGQAEYKLMIPKMPMPLTISANAFWQHEYLNNSHGITAALAGAGSGSFITNVSNPGRDSALIGAGVSGKVCRYATLFANYEAQIGPKDQHSQSIMVGMAVSF